MFMGRNLTGVRSGPSYAGVLSSAVVDEGTGAVTDLACLSIRFRYRNAYCIWLYHDLVIYL